jgi:hypothetical protein
MRLQRKQLALPNLPVTAWQFTVFDFDAVHFDTVQIAKDHLPAA